MRFHTAFGAAELRPGKQIQAQRDGGRVQAEQFVLEAELVLAVAERATVAEAGQRGPEEVLEQRSGAVLVGIRKGGPAGRFGDAEVHELAETATEAVADLAQRIGAAQLAKEHGHELGPAGEAFGGAFGAVFLDESGELGAGEVVEQLIEEAGGL
mgnify:CR=1 FL=1